MFLSAFFMPEAYNENETTKGCQVRMNMPRSQTKPPEDELAPVPAPPKNMGAGGDRFRRALRWVVTCLPLGGIAWASFLPLQTWMQQALILVALIWFYVFFLLDTFFLGG
jgi:hypothetical protein